jgi:hypothetical protein
MKIGDLASKINSILEHEVTGFNSKNYITAVKINGYKKMGLIPNLRQANGKSYSDFNDFHFSLILKAYKKIVINKTRTRDAFLQALDEIKAPSFL